MTEYHVMADGLVWSKHETLKDATQEQSNIHAVTTDEILKLSYEIANKTEFLESLEIKKS